MDRVVERPPLSAISGQLRLAIVGDYKKETLREDLAIFSRDLLFYTSNHLFRLVSSLGKFLFSGFKLSEGFKSWLARRFMRRKGQLAFPFAHLSLVGISFSLLILTTGLGGFIFKKAEPETASLSASILADDAEFITEESEIGSTKGTTHEVKAGDTVESIARYFKSNAQQIVELNYIMGSGDLYKYVSANKELYPGGKILVPLPRTYTAGSFTIPAGTCQEVALGYPTDGGAGDVIGAYTWGHRGVDFGGSYGEPLYAVAD